MRLQTRIAKLVIEMGVSRNGARGKQRPAIHFSTEPLRRESQELSE